MIATKAPTRIPTPALGLRIDRHDGHRRRRRAGRPRDTRRVPVTTDDVREIARDLPRSCEVLVRGRVKFRVGQIVWLALSADEERLGFAFPKEEREAMITAEPGKFVRPAEPDLRFNWLEVRLPALDRVELRELVLDAWRMVVPKRVARAHLGD